MNIKLYGFVFIPNPLINEYLCVHRDNYEEAFNNYNSENVLRSSKISTLEELIIKYGNCKEAKKHLK